MIVTYRSDVVNGGQTWMRFRVTDRLPDPERFNVIVKQLFKELGYDVVHIQIELEEDEQP